MLALDIDSGQFGPDKKSSLTINLHQMLSDGYQTYNYQKRVAGFIKYQYRLNNRTTFTLFSGLVDLWTNTPNLKGPSRAQIGLFGDNYLMSGDPSQPNYYGYNFYHVQTDFSYIGVNTDLGHGWKLDNKVYTYRYWNKQNYNNPSLGANGLFSTTGGITATSGVDKLNGYRKAGDITTLSWESSRGILRTGLWYEWAYTDRYQIPGDPRTWVDAALPNFHEHFITTSAQPFAEYEYKVTHDLSVTAGMKVAQYGMNLTQYADNGKTVGNLGGAPSVFHAADYRAWMPSIDARYKIKTNWTAYAQFATGSNIPPSSVFDSKGAQVAVLPQSNGGQDLPGGLGGEIQPVDAGCGRLLQPLPEPLLVVPGLSGRVLLLPDRSVEHEGHRSREQYHDRLGIQCLPERDRGVGQIPGRQELR